MNIENILNDVGIHSETYKQIQAGRNSLVYKVTDNNRNHYALRILKKEVYAQALKEVEIMKIVSKYDIPVPKVFSLVINENHVIMLMEWIDGLTLLSQLQLEPDNAITFGVEFGKVHAKINSIIVEDDNHIKSSWLTPDKNELELLNKIEHLNKNSERHMLHLDFHPLNVLIKGGEIKAIIDWANAGIGDYRFDFSRTNSILELEGKNHLDKNVLMQFIKGYRQGYQDIIGPFHSLEIFNAWAGIRMLRDLEGWLDPDLRNQINSWVKEALKHHRNGSLGSS
jgi:aminoglycoside phosphotransferase (APT) family kinase protein